MICGDCNGNDDQCFNCNGTGEMCDVCGEAIDACICEGEDDAADVGDLDLNDDEP